MQSFNIKNKMESFYHGQCIRVTVFPKTGTTFMHQMAEAHESLISSTENNPVKHYISVRTPLSRFVSGFLTMYYRSHHPNLNSDYADLYANIHSLSIKDALYECFSALDNDWSFDPHTSNCYDRLPALEPTQIFIEYTDIGLLLQKMGYLPNTTIPIDQFQNSNPINAKEELLGIIANDKILYKKLHHYLNADIEIYQKLPIIKLTA